MRSRTLYQICYRCLFLLILSCGVSTPLIFAQGKSKPKRIAILELANRTRQQVSLEEIHYLTNEMRRVAGFLPSDEFLVMTKESIEVLIDPDKSLEDCIGVCEVETGRLLGADWILTGEVIRFGKSLRVSVKLHDTKSGQYLAGESLKGKQVEDLELPIQESTLKLIYQISPDLERQASSRVGSEISKQLDCFKNLSSCRLKTAKPSSTQPRRSTSLSSEASTVRVTRPTRAQRKPAPYVPRARPSEHESESGFGLTVDAFGLLLFGPTVALEFGEQVSFRVLARGMKLGAISSLALAPEDGDRFDSGSSVGVGYRKFNDRDNARRGLYWGVDLEYMMIETSYSEGGRSFSTTSTALTSVLHLGYRWVSDNMLIGDLFGIGLWLAYAQPLEISQSFSDSADWPESYTETSYDSQIYGGIAMDFGWMF